MHRVNRVVFRVGLPVLAAIAASAAAALAQTGAPTVTQMAYPTGSRAGSILLLERIAPSTVKLNTEFDYILRLTNITNAEIRSITLTETPGADLEIRSTMPQAGQQGREYGWRIDALPPQAMIEVRVRAFARRLGQVEGCASITLRADSCGPIQVVQPALELVKNAPAEALWCDPIPLRFIVSNPGSGVASNVRLHDPLPDGWQTESGQSEIHIDVGMLGPGQSREFTVPVRSANPGSFSNTAVVSADDGLTARATAATRVVRPVLQLVKTSPSMRYLGREVEFALEIRNVGDAPAQQTMLVDALPAGLQFVGASDGGRFEGGRVTWALGVLNPGEARRVTLTTQGRQIGSYMNQASATAYCAEAAAQAPVEVRGIAAVLLEVVDLEDPIEVGRNETYVITVTNQGTAVGTGIRIVCEIQPEAEYISADGPTQPAIDGRSVNFAPLGTLAPRAQATYRVVVRAMREGDTRFRVTLTTDQTETPIEETEATRFY